MAALNQVMDEKQIKAVLQPLQHPNEVLIDTERCMQATRLAWDRVFSPCPPLISDSQLFVILRDESLKKKTGCVRGGA